MIDRMIREKQITENIVGEIGKEMVIATSEKLKDLKAMKAYYQVVADEFNDAIINADYMNEAETTDKTVEQILRK